MSTVGSGSLSAPGGQGDYYSPVTAPCKEATQRPRAGRGAAPSEAGGTENCRFTAFLLCVSLDAVARARVPVPRGCLQRAN